MADRRSRGALRRHRVQTGPPRFAPSVRTRMRRRSVEIPVRPRPRGCSSTRPRSSPCSQPPSALRAGTTAGGTRGGFPPRRSRAGRMSRTGRARRRGHRRVPRRSRGRRRPSPRAGRCPSHRPPPRSAPLTSSGPRWMSRCRAAAARGNSFRIRHRRRPCRPEDESGGGPRLRAPRVRRHDRSGRPGRLQRRTLSHHMSASALDESLFDDHQIPELQHPEDRLGGRDREFHAAV